MCGFAGYFSKYDDASVNVCREMISRIAYRGPDASGVWCDPSGVITLGHQRLSIQDLSPEGNQPMMSSSGRYAIAFNGEIYNFQVLKKELVKKGHFFRGCSDTEVLLSAVEEWGVKGALTRFVGMFAFALWDKVESTLVLSRDRMGEKPLYYGWRGRSFLFGSELAAFKAHPSWTSDIDRGALSLYMRHNCVPAPYSIYKGVFKLPPGTLLTLPISLDIGRVPDPETYWSVKEVAEKGVSKPFLGTEVEAVEELEKLLLSTMSEKMISDVPLGAFLSGGVDSSLVVALMQSISEKPVKTFSIGFHEAAYNEAQHAKTVAKSIGTEHTELYVTPADAMNVIPKLPLLYNEPFSDSSQVPTYLVSSLAKEHVTVVLSGDGGDELFAGYNRHINGQMLWDKLSKVPVFVRSMVAGGITSISPERWNNLGHLLGRITPKLQGRTGNKMHKLAGILAVSSPEEMYMNLVSHWEDPASVVLGGYEPLSILTNQDAHADLNEMVQQMQYLDMMTYLPDDILVKVDRAAMGNSLETRVPFLDHRVVEFAWHIPTSMKIKNGQSKWLLREVLYKYVDKSLIDRPKMGFAVPIDSWLRNELRDWAEDLLCERRLETEGFFNVKLVRQRWHEHLSGKRNWQYHLWDVLMFQSWLIENE